MIRAVLFDLDGVLVDACEWHKLSLNRALMDVAGFELNDEEHKTTFNGLPTKKKTDLLVKQGRLRIEQCDQVFQLKQKYTKDTILATAKVDTVKEELMQYLKQMNIKVACVTNSITETAQLMLQTTGQFRYIDLLISNEQVRQPKPHGEGYIRAMVHFGTKPDETLIVEDSEVGLKAAYSTGAYVLPVRDSYDVTMANVKAEVEKW